jgi:ParB-like chromosome segregation protein Spo0J
MVKKKQDYTALAQETLTRTVELDEREEPIVRRDVVVGTKRMADARLIPIDKLDFDPDQPREEIDEEGEAFQGFVSSIAEHGLIQTLMVEYVPEQDRYKLIVGERRLRALQRLRLLRQLGDTERVAAIRGFKIIQALDASKQDEAINRLIAAINRHDWTEVPCMVKEKVSDVERLELQLIENVQREDFNPIEKARGLLAYKKRLGPDTAWDMVEQRMGLTRRRRQHFSALLKLPDWLQQEIARDKKKIFTEKHGRGLLLLNRFPEKQRKLFDKVFASNGELSGDDVIAEARRMLGKVKSAYEFVVKYKDHAFSVTYRDTQELLKKLEAEVKKLMMKVYK